MMPIRSARRLLLPMLLVSVLSAHAQWQAQRSGTKASLRGLSVVNAQTAWASGTGGTVLRTTDGGRTWAALAVPGAESLDFRGIKAFDSETAVVMSAGQAEQGKARIYLTSNAGRSWQQVFSSSAPGMFLDAIAFWDRWHGIAISDPVAGGFVVILTDDGGKSWKQVASENIPAALKGEGAFAASNSCLAVQGKRHGWFGTGGGGSARVFISSDRGRNWRVVATPMVAGAPSSGIFSLAFRDDQKGVAAGGDYQKAATSSGNASLTSDGGKTWTAPGAGPSPLYLSSVAYIPGGASLVAVGTAGWARSEDGGDHWVVHQDPGFNAVSFGRTADSGWAVGSDGRIAKFNGLK
jgi:photosystem II stability/assembly factor-like uncharacterized protein